MKDTELMIGDWVLDKDNECPRQVNIKDFRNSGKRILGSFKPIPLTTGILEKNGFVAKERGHYCAYGLGSGEHYIWIHHQNEHIACSTPDNRNELALFGMIVLRYVHDLQHALKLCGVETDITL